MIYNIVTQSLISLSAECVSKDSNLIFVASAMLNSLLCILLIPVTIRLAGQLIAQVFKYRYILNNHIRECDDDSKVITAYYQHFQIFVGIILCMFGFCIFNTIYLIYTSVSVISQEWEKQYLIGSFAGAFAQSFQEGIVLFGVTLLLQIANYFKGKKVQLKLIITLIIARMGYVLVLEISQILSQFIEPLDGYQFYGVYFIIIGIFYGIDIITRVFTVFAFMRMSIIIVHKRIIEFITHLHTRFLEWNRYADKIIAFKLMKVAAWGTYSLVLINFLDTLSCVGIYPITTYKLLYSYYIEQSYYTAQYILFAILIFISILSILPSILYSIFLVITWLVFRERTKVRYSGFRTGDVTREQLLPNEPLFSNQDHLHQIYYKHKNRIHLASYVVLIMSVSCLFSLFLTPLMIQHSRERFALLPGEYYAFDNSFKDCQFISYHHLESQNCSVNLKGLKFQKPFKQSLTTQYNMPNYGMITWIPQNSTVPNHCYHSIKGTVIETKFSVELNLPYETPHNLFYYSNLYPVYLNFCPIASNGTEIHESQGVYNVKTSGLYQISPLAYNNTWCILNITRSIDLITDIIPYSQFTQGTNIADLDALIYEPTTIVDYDNSNYCELTIFCYYNPVWPILFGIAVFLTTLFIQVSLLYCIHRI